jgi:hypothetical protein
MATRTGISGSLRYYARRASWALEAEAVALSIAGGAMVLLLVSPFFLVLLPLVVRLAGSWRSRVWCRSSGPSSLRSSSQPSRCTIEALLWIGDGADRSDDLDVHQRVVIIGVELDAQIEAVRHPKAGDGASKTALEGREGI